MRTVFLGCCALLLYAGFLISAFFSDTSAGNSSGEVVYVKQELKLDSLNTDQGNYSEQYRPPVFIGIGPGGPVNHTIHLKTGIIKTSEVNSLK